MSSSSNILSLSVDELSNVLSFIAPKQLIKCCISINKSFNAAIYHGNTWNCARLSSRQLFKCKNDNIFSNFAKHSWNSLCRFSFINYKTSLNRKQKQILKDRLLAILNSSHNCLQSLQLHGVDISVFNNDSHYMKALQNLDVLWMISPNREHTITEGVWCSLISSHKLITLEFMSNYPLNVDDIKHIKCAFERKGNGTYHLKNLKLSIESDIECNKESVKLIDLLSESLEIVFLTGMKHIHNAETEVADALCKCKGLLVLSLMYRNRYDVADLYSHIDCYNLLYELSFALVNLKVFSLEYGPLVDYEWQQKYKQHISLYFKSLIWVKIGQNRIKNSFLPTVISPNVKCNRFCLSWNANA